MLRVAQNISVGESIGAGATISGLTTAVSGYVALTAATNLPPVFCYTIYAASTHEWEVGMGRMSGGNLVRLAALATSAEPAAATQLLDIAASTAVVSLGPKPTDAESLSLSLFGTGADGDLTVTGSVTYTTSALTYGTITISGAGSINVTAGSTIRCQVLDLRNAGAGAILGDGQTGNNSTTTSGASALTGTGSGGSGSTGNSTPPNAPSYGSLYGGSPGNGGKGGNSVSNTGGTPSTITTWTRRYSSLLTADAPALGRAAGGRGGAGGAGNGSTAGSGGGGGGQGPNRVCIYARTILVGPSTAVRAISLRGGNGGNVNRAGVAGTGGGGGGGGGAGGMCYVVTEAIGGTATGVIDVSGGNGGNGGAGDGSTTYGGHGGDGGGSGQVYLINLGAPSLTRYVEGTAGSAGTAGALDGGTAAGGAGAVLQVNLP